MTGDTSPRRHWQGLLLAALAIGSFILCVAGFLSIEGGLNLTDWRTWSDALYKSIRIWALEYDGPGAPEEVPLSLHVGRAGALISVLWGTWMAAVALLKERTTPFLLWLREPQIVFCGMTPELLRIARSEEKLRPGRRLALIVADASSALALQFRKELSSLIVVGDPTVAQNLAICRIHRSRCLYVAGDTDTQTLQIVQAIAEHVVQETHHSIAPLKVIALLQDRTKLRVLPAALERLDRQRVDLNWIDPVMLAVRLMLERSPPDTSLTAGHERLHVVLAGSTAFIEALLVQLARNVYPREQITLITVIAADATQFYQNLCERYPALAEDFPDRQLFAGLYPLVEIQAIDQNPATLATTELARLEQQAPIACAYVHAGQDGDTVLTSRRLLQLRVRSELDFPIGAYFDEPRELESVIAVSAEEDIFRSRPEESYLGERLDTLAMLNNYVYQPGVVVPDLGAPAAEQDQAWLQANEQWRITPEWRRDSSRHVADHIAVKLRYLGLDAQAFSGLTLQAATTLRQNLPEALPRLGSLEHRRYCAERMLEGWLPVSPELWNEEGADEATVEKRRSYLKSLQLNATLTMQIDAAEMEKDKRLAANIAWILWQTASRSVRDPQGASSKS